jgi:hypothetical protein
MRSLRKVKLLIFHLVTEPASRLYYKEEATPKPVQPLAGNAWNAA